MKVVHFGDLHVWRLPFAPYDAFYFKRYLGAFNLLFHRRKKFPPALGQKVIEQILQEDADLVVFSGDFTTSAQKNEFALARKLFEPLLEKWGERLFVIPGNHDRYTVKSVKQDWFGSFFPYGKIDGVRVQELDNDYVVVGYDASQAFLIRSNGYFSDELAVQLEATLAQLVDKKVILVGHYPVEYPANVEIKADHEMIGRQKLRTIMQKYPPVLYLHGHKHIRWQIETAVNCGAAGMVSSDRDNQAGYCLIELDSSNGGLPVVEKKVVSL